MYIIVNRFYSYKNVWSGYFHIKIVRQRNNDRVCNYYIIYKQTGVKLEHWALKCHKKSNELK